MQTNKASLPMMSVQGRVDYSIISGDGYRVGYDGHGRISMAAGGIIYSYKIDDSYVDITGDYIEPGVSLKNPVEKGNNVPQVSARIGNKTKVISGDAKGKEGYVTGKRSDINHIMVYLDEETLELVTTEDRVLIKAYGQGLKLTDYEEIQLTNIDSALLEGSGIAEEEQRIEISVVACIPVYLMRDGLGSTITMLGNYDIMIQDAQADREFEINELRFGDLAMVQDHDNHNGSHYHREVVSVGTVVRADSYISGRSPGLAVIMSSRCGNIESILDPNTNVANYLYTK